MEDDNYKSEMVVDGTDFRRLYAAVKNSYEKTAWFRNLVKNLVKEFCGPAYGEKPDGLDKPLNKMFQLIEAYLMLTAPSNPTVEVVPKQGKEAFRAFARHWQDATNNLAEEIGAEDTIRAWVQDAFFGMGVVKLHRESYRLMEFAGELVDPGIPTASNVPPDDFVFDMTAKRWPKQVKFCADKYRIPFAQLTDGAASGIYDPKVVKQLRPTTKMNQDPGRVAEIGTGELTDEDELEPMIDVADVWVAKSNKIYTCVLSDPNTFCLKKDTPPLSAIDWHDPDFPPYHILRFSEVPHNILPVSPAAQLWPLDKAINNVARKEIKRTIDQKRVAVFEGQDEQTAATYKREPDGGLIKGSKDSIGYIETGGIDQNMHQMLVAMDSWFDILSGNLSSLAGLGASAGTVGQEQIIANASNKKVNSLQARVAKAAAVMFRGLGIMLWHDEILEIATEVSAGGYTAADAFTPGDRVGNFIDYNFRRNVYSNVDSPPAAQAELLMAVVERIFLPMQQMMMQQGGQVNFAVLTQKLATLLNQPAFEQILQFVPPPEQEAGEATTNLKPPSTTRTHVRKNVRQETSPQEVLQQTLTAMQASNNQQMAAV